MSYAIIKLRHRKKVAHMSISNSIRLTLNIKDLNITFSEDYLKEEKIKDVLALVFNGKLSPAAPGSCPCCGTVNKDHSIIKNGSKEVMIKMPKVSERMTFLKLKRQRYFCRSCNRTFSAKTDLVKERCSISRNTFHALILAAKKKLSVKDIVENFDISHGTLNNFLISLSDKFIVSKDTLPEHLLFDEFKSVKSCDASMSFIYMDAQTHQVVDIVYNRQLGHLKSYFLAYPKEVRDKVKTICIDMYSPYIELIRSCFPKAKIIIDRFHVVQLISRSLNKTRIQTMNANKDHYTKLKRYWRLLLKNNNDLDRLNYRYFRCFKYHMTESEVVSEILRVDNEFESTYYFYQEYLNAFQNKDFERCKTLVNNPPNNISEHMKKSAKTLSKYEPYINNALSYPFSNGALEGTNNLIKVIKRIAFGYRSYESFRTRILLITNTLVRLEYK